jgi:hypothetical protein
MQISVLPHHCMRCSMILLVGISLLVNLAASATVRCSDGYEPFHEMSILGENLDPAFGSPMPAEFNSSICCMKGMMGYNAFQCPIGIMLSQATNNQYILTVQCSNTMLFAQLPRISANGSMIFFSLQPDSAGNSKILVGNSSGSTFLPIAGFMLKIQRPRLTPNFVLNNVAACPDRSLACACPLPGNPSIPTPAIVLSCDRGCPLQAQAGFGTFVQYDPTTYLRLQDNSSALAVLFYNASDTRWFVSIDSCRVLTRCSCFALLKETTTQSLADADFA